MQADPGKNYFELFGLPGTYTINRSDLTARYQDLQRHFHPDKFSSSSDQERRLSVQMTALINEAYQALKDPIARGQYILSLAGSNTDTETDTAMEPAFLLEQMELREKLEALNDNPDAQRLTAMAESASEKMEIRVTQLHDLLDGHERNLEQARNVLREMQFIDKLQREIESLEDQLL
ncbi:MAG: co-chaperone HscB [Gammaproteobacteria bacterium]|nr:MAG: co-chaperone HscB [Gammaproteobacteria bacterium]